MNLDRKTPARILAAFVLTCPAIAQDWIIPAGTVVQYQTDPFSSPLFFNRVVIEPGATLRVQGSWPLSLVCAELEVHGTLEASGDDSLGVLTLNTTNQPEVGALAGAGGGDGGTGSAATNASTALGGPGSPSLFTGSGIGGFGGESSFGLGGTDVRRGAGGGGGRLAADDPQVNVPLDPQNLGYVATDGFDGGPLGTSAFTLQGPARGGTAGDSYFVDSDPTNDFWGLQVLPSGASVRGEARRPTGGRGGGAGGDASSTAVFPSPFVPTGDEKGAGGGGGGGLVLIKARRIVIGSEGRIRADGGDGGGGENTFFFDRVGGGSGGGSGGWIALDALEFDLSLASEDAITALGGRGGVGRQDRHDVVGAGGNGGPGVVQLHTVDGSASSIALPVGRSVEDLTAPNAYLLLPIGR